MGVAWHPLDVSRRRRKQEVASVWSRAPATRSSSSWWEEDDDWQSQSTWAEPGGWASTGKAQVGFFLLFFYLVSVFNLTATVGL